MKTIFWSALVWFGTLNAVPADQFQFTRTKDGATANITFATVRIVDGDKTTFAGKTDKYGRITIDIPKGQYEAEIIHGAAKNKVKLTIDSQKPLKQLEVK